MKAASAKTRLVDVRELEEAAFDAWPPEIVVVADGWRLRFMQGVTRRANSVWPNDCTADVPLERRIEDAERFYGDRGLPARFQVGPIACPDRLDDRLARMGYMVDAPVSIQVATPTDVQCTAPSNVDVQVAKEPSAVWLDLAGHRGRYASQMAVFEGLVGRIGTRGAYAVARLDGEPAGTGLGVTDGHLAGLFAMTTLPGLRRRGVGRALLEALVRSAEGRGARRLYLQVERDNVPALALYQSAGFRELYGYHYRLQSPV